MTRRERFKQYVSNVAAAASPALAIAQQLYVQPPNAISDLIVGHLELDPASRHLVVGNIGAGKTTQLLVAAQKLRALGDVCAIYIDVSESQDLGNLKPGCLVALTGLELLKREPELGGKRERDRFIDWASGYHPQEDDYYGGDYEPRFVAGVLTPPQSEWNEIDGAQVDRLATFCEREGASGRHLVVLFDSLDRVTDLAAFVKLVSQDVAALRHCKIGVVMVGPIRSLEGFGRLDVDRFDKLHLQGPIDVEADPRGFQFLFRVIRTRAAPDILTDDAADALVICSGGVLRDLISIAKAAGDEAYLGGADLIEKAHVISAADAFGRSLMIGLKQEDIETLKVVRGTGGFVRTSDSDLALVATRRVLQYQRRSLQYAVHPTIGPLLDQKAG